ncbi:ChbG/HpnK family deacetylase [uncultured Paludibaculum sp.]|uniref:ChbG/HpnK family deacetylase n=1 Tax=uncultured Paludibaculum sp. TaxID=1765020 RepID=UPI002AABBE8E|nr:ChbG/HpnK family deacetylase [uncultured Paludibaculum sp.]
MDDRRLAVNADDFGFTHDVNAGIVEAHTRGILTSTTLMANGAAFADAVRLAAEVPTLDIGVHLVLVGGVSLLGGGRPLPDTVGAMMRSVVTKDLRVYDELRAQMVRIFEAGLRPTHLDTHKHTHLFPPVLDAVARLSEEFGVRWVRRPFDFPLSGSPSEVPWRKRAVSRMLGSVRGQFHRKLGQHGCRTTDWFAGFQITGRFHAEDVLHLLENLPVGSTEFMVHPGLCTEELRAARTRLKESREAELRALTDERVVAAVRRLGIRLCGYGPKLGGARE